MEGDSKFIYPFSYLILWYNPAYSMFLCKTSFVTHFLSQYLTEEKKISQAPAWMNIAFTELNVWFKVFIRESWMLSCIAFSKWCVLMLNSLTVWGCYPVSGLSDCFQKLNEKVRESLSEFIVTDSSVSIQNIGSRAVWSCVTVYAVWMYKMWETEKVCVEQWLSRLTVD